MPDPDTSTQAKAKSASTETFVSALVLNLVIFGVEIVGFTLLRKGFKAIYEPRTYIPPENKRQKPLSENIFGWPLSVWKADYRDVKHQNGMDAYFFLRYLRMMITILLPIWLVSWAILLPTTSVGIDVPGADRLDMFTFGHVDASHQNRYAAHIILVYFFTFWIFYNIRKEMRNFVTERQRHLVDPVHSSTAQANTVLITGVPVKFLNEKALIALFSHLPGGVRKVWVNRDLKDLPDLYDNRLKACNKLESAEVSLMKTASKLHRKKQKKGDKGSTEHLTDTEHDQSLAARLVPAKDRPSHRLPAGFLPFSLPFIGKKVDSIEWAREEINKMNTLIDDQRAILNKENQMMITGIPQGTKLQYPPLNSAFILFNQQIAAHMAAQILTHNEPYRMSTKYTEVAPADVIWSNLGMNPYEQKIRTALSYAATGALIIFWAIPVTFVGVVSNVSGLCVKYSWLAWLCKTPSPVNGIIQGILPPVLLAVLTSLLPVILRLFARFEGIPRRTGIELSLMTRFYIFQVVHNFLVVTLASGIIKALPQLVSNPTSIPSLLAQNLPSASTFFLTYIVLQGLAGTAAGFLQIVPLIIYYAKLFILGSTPRSVYSIKYDLRDVAWGTLFPSMTLITTIAVGYQIISPLINGFACAAFFLLYVMWKYLFLWQLDQPASGDTGGLFFPKAIQHLFVGLYVEQVCLTALFFLARNGQGKASAIPEGALMIVLIVLTVGYNIIINNSYGPLEHDLPLTLADKSYGMPPPSRDAVGVNIGEEDEGFGGDDDSSSDPAKAEKRAQLAREEAEESQRAEAGRSAVGSGAGTKDASDQYGASVGVEGKRNDGPTDFNHPAAVEPQRVIWIPQDPLGLGAAEAAAIHADGIEVSTEKARMSEKGTVDIEGHPPGMDPTKIFG